MNRTAFYILTVLTFVLASAAFAQDRPAPEAKRQAKPSPEAARRRGEGLSAEERAKLKEKWQNMSEEERTKFREQMRQRVGGADQGAQVQDRKQLMAAQIARLKEEHKATVGELEAIKQLALKENAKQTAEALTKLIAKHEKQFEQQMQAVERRMKAGSGDPEAKPAAPRQRDADKQKAQREDRSQKEGARTRPQREKKEQ
jgi:hypothetical protein